MKNIIRPLVGLLVLCCLIAAAWYLSISRSVETQYAENQEAAKSLIEEGSYAEAATRLQEALDAARQIDPKDERVDRAISDLAEAYGAQGEYVETQHLHMEALQRTIEKHGPDSPEAGRAYNRLGRSTALQGNHTVAEGMYNQAVAVWDKLGAEQHAADAAESHAGLAATLAALERYEEADSKFQRAIELREKQLGSEAPELAPLLREHAAVLTQLDRKDEAEKAAARADLLFPPTATPTITATPTLTPTNTVPPTATPVPTDTPQPPTPTAQTQPTQRAQAATPASTPPSGQPTSAKAIVTP